MRRVIVVMCVLRIIKLKLTLSMNRLVNKCCPQAYLIFSLIEKLGKDNCVN